MNECPGLLTTAYFFELSICGGPDMAPALPQAADIRLGADSRIRPSI